MNWFDILPASVARNQTAWERRRRIRRCLDRGVRQKEVALYLGITPPRVWQMVHRKDDDVPPASRFLGDAFDAAKALLEA